MERIIGQYGGKNKGPLLIAIGGTHGNEWAGVLAIERMFALLAIEEKDNPAFQFNGLLLGLRGNLKALASKKRFIEKDLNRLFNKAHIEQLLRLPTTQLENEHQELAELLSVIHQAIQSFQPTQVIVLDFHTTTAHGAAFSVVTDNLVSLKIALQLHVPVILGLLEGVHDTSLHYFNTDNLGVETVAIGFEAGQHEEPAAVDRSISALVNCMRYIGCVPQNVVEKRHDELLKDYSAHLPKIVQFKYVHKIKPNDQFEMLPGFTNFQPIRKGQPIAQDNSGTITAQRNGMILMPLYQKQGEDGFFIVEPIEEIAY